MSVHSRKANRGKGASELCFSEAPLLPRCFSEAPLLPHCFSKAPLGLGSSPREGSTLLFLALVGLPGYQHGEGAGMVTCCGRTWLQVSEICFKIKKSPAIRSHSGDVTCPSIHRRLGATRSAPRWVARAAVPALGFCSSCGFCFWQQGRFGNHLCAEAAASLEQLCGLQGTSRRSRTAAGSPCRDLPGCSPAPFHAGAGSFLAIPADIPSQKIFEREKPGVSQEDCLPPERQSCDPWQRRTAGVSHCLSP